MVKAMNDGDKNNEKWTSAGISKRHKAELGFPESFSKDRWE